MEAGKATSAVGGFTKKRRLLPREGCAESSPEEEVYRGSARKTRPGESLPGKTGSDDLTLCIVYCNNY